jgi:hypothetical protein
LFFPFEGDVIFGTDNGLYRFDAKKQRFSLDDRFRFAFNSSRNVRRLSPDGEGATGTTRPIWRPAVFGDRAMEPGKRKLSLTKSSNGREIYGFFPLDKGQTLLQLLMV